MAYQGVWILGEQKDGRIHSVSLELLGRGRALADKLNCELTAVILGDKLSENGLQDLIQRGADMVLAMENPALSDFLVEPHAACMAHLINKYKPEILIAAATTMGRTLMPYLAAKIDAGLTADCTELDIEPKTGNLLQTRPAIGGNILATIKTPAKRPQMATVRPRSSRPAERMSGRNGKIERISAPVQLLASRIKRVGFVKDTSEHGLQEADVVVSVGRGIKKPDNLPLAEELARSLQAAVGASRDVVDRGWIGYPHQVGLSGKTVSPKLYIALGISGAIQHLAGMQTAQTIVAINQDPDAQIFRVADIGLVGDVLEILPVLTDRLARLGRGPAQTNTKKDSNRK